MAFGRTAADPALAIVDDVPVVVSVGNGRPSFAKNNQLRTGADKGNPTV